jgi:hypothetical protein
MDVLSAYGRALDKWFEFVSTIFELEAQLAGDVSYSALSIEPGVLRSSYADQGFIAFELDPSVTNLLNDYFSPNHQIKFSFSDCAQNFYPGNLDELVIEKLNRDMVYYSEPSNHAQLVLSTIIFKLAPFIEASIGCKFSISNVRAWNTKKTDNIQHGPTELHVDGLSEFVRKLMIYPEPPNPDNGTLEIIGRNGKAFVLNSAANPMAILADVGTLKHRGINPSVSQMRPMIEITLVPSLDLNISTHFQGQNARVAFLQDNDFRDVKNHIYSLQHKLQSDLKPRNEIVNEVNVNIGGGRGFSYPGWLNFDAASPKIPSKMIFASNTKFPYPSNFARCVYSSHCLEHLSDEVVSYLLLEVGRILSPDGCFVLKLPNFERVLFERKQNITDGILNPDLWGLTPLFDMWQRNNIAISTDSIAAMIFCGFWNTEYGEEFFARSVPLSQAAYHGPPRITSDRTKRIFESSKSPHFIASLLRSEVDQVEKSPKFNHQNAWSFDEFVGLADVHGLELVEHDDIFNKHSDIPTLHDMKNISQYFVFRKRY